MSVYQTDCHVSHQATVRTCSLAHRNATITYPHSFFLLTNRHKMVPILLNREWVKVFTHIKPKTNYTSLRKKSPLKLCSCTHPNYPLISNLWWEVMLSGVLNARFLFFFQISQVISGTRVLISCLGSPLHVANASHQSWIVVIGFHDVGLGCSYDVYVTIMFHILIVYLYSEVESCLRDLYVSG